jgi:hypothetical protein
MASASKRMMQLQCPMPKLDFELITLGHGSGGVLTNRLVRLHSRLIALSFPLFSFLEVILGNYLCMGLSMTLQCAERFRNIFH